MIRKTFFWAHLVCGVLTGIVVFTMSITGVLLTYERQILAWSAQSHFVPAEQQTTRLPLEQLLLIAKTANPELTPSSITVHSDPGAPIELRAGRSGGASVNPYTGDSLQEASPGLENFFRSMTGFHRWFLINGEGRSAARKITGLSNLLFLFLVLSGMYLWLPRLWKWGIFKARLFFNNKVSTSKARDFNWHHVFGIWSAIPLIVVVATATVFSYSWSNNLVYRAFGEEPPVRRGRGGPPPAAGPGAINPIPNNGTQPTTSEYLNLDQLLAAADKFVDGIDGDWKNISINLPSPSSATASFSIDQGNGGQPHLRHSLTLNRTTAEVTEWKPFSSQSAGQQARNIVRFLHTGEALGIWGQTIAGLVSLASLFMVWTGFALSYRRLIQPLFRKKT